MSVHIIRGASPLAAPRRIFVECETCGHLGEFRVTAEQPEESCLQRAEWLKWDHQCSSQNKFPGRAIRREPTGDVVSGSDDRPF